MSAWIEINYCQFGKAYALVALLVSAWIEIENEGSTAGKPTVALLVSAWIEIVLIGAKKITPPSRTPCECVD